MPLPSAPAEFYGELAAAGKKGETEFLTLLFDAHKRGWVDILGATEQDPRDIVAVLQEHFSVKLIQGGDSK